MLALYNFNWTNKPHQEDLSLLPHKIPIFKTLARKKKIMSQSLFKSLLKLPRISISTNSFVLSFPCYSSNFSKNLYLPNSTRTTCILRTIKCYSNNSTNNSNSNSHEIGSGIGFGRELLGLTDEQLLSQCDMSTFKSSGPGGQHRNKRETAVRLKHLPTGIIAQVRLLIFF